MFLVLLFLFLAALGSYLFPEWSGVAVLLVSSGGVVLFRLALHAFHRREVKKAEKTEKEGEFRKG